MINKDIVQLLDSEAKEINRIEFIDDDPVQFPRRYSDIRDIEITALLVSAISWGNRKMILQDSQRLLALMEHQPYNYMMDRAYEELPPRLNIHRTFFSENLAHFLRGLHSIYKTYESLDKFCSLRHINTSQTPAWELAKQINAIMFEANNCTSDSRCLPLNNDSSALKRLNMALRWLVRDDGIVDLGVWRSLRPSQLFIPLDVHVAAVSRDFGLLTRRSNDRKAVIEITDNLRKIRPEDPVFYDYALFGIGVTGRRQAISL